jgi:DNA-binding Lrp family transcriptional regulator
MKACVLVKVVPGKHKEVATALVGQDGVKAAFPTLGRQDVVADVEVSGLRELASLISQVQALSGVRGTETLIGVEV